MEHKDKMNNSKDIYVTETFYPRPKWRYRREGQGSGEAFREDVLKDAIENNTHVNVILSGYNRYGPSFISEAFGGLIRNEGFTLEQLKAKLTVVHDKLPSIVQSCWLEIEKAQKEINNG